MKILLVSHFFPPERIAGAEKLAFGYASELQDHGHSVQVVCAGDWEEGSQNWNGSSDEIFQGISVHKVNLNWTKAKDPNQTLYDNQAIEAYLDQHLDTWKPDIVHVISLITLSASVARVVKKHAIPLVFTLVDFWMICPKISLVRGDETLCDGQVSPNECLKCLLWNSKAYHGLRRLLPESQTISLLEWASQKPSINRIRGLRGMALNMEERRRVLAEIAPLFDYVMAPSTNLGKVIDRIHIFPFPVRIVHSGHDLSWLKNMPEKSDSDKLRFGFIGQIIPVKGIHLLLQAFQEAGGEEIAELFIYGDASVDPQYVDTLKSLVHQNSSIYFKDVFPHSQLGKVLSGIDILVVPSQWHENNPRVIQEAFASKTPVIASNVGGIAEFIQHDVNGLLFHHDSIGDLRAQIERVLKEPGLIDRLAGGIGPVKTIAEEVDEIIAIYRQLAPGAA